MFLSSSLSIVEIRWTKSRGTASFLLLVIKSKLWLETSRGLNRLNKKTPKFLRRPESVESRSVRARKRVARCQQSAQQPLEKKKTPFCSTSLGSLPTSLLLTNSTVSRTYTLWSKPWDSKHGLISKQQGDGNYTISKLFRGHRWFSSLTAWCPG